MLPLPRCFCVLVALQVRGVTYIPEKSPVPACGSITVSKRPALPARRQPSSFSARPGLCPVSAHLPVLHDSGEGTRATGALSCLASRTGHRGSEVHVPCGVSGSPLPPCLRCAPPAPHTGRPPGLFPPVPAVDTASGNLHARVFACTQAFVPPLWGLWGSRWGLR